MAAGRKIHLQPLSTSRGQLFCIFLTQYVEFKCYAATFPDSHLNSSTTRLNTYLYIPRVAIFMCWKGSHPAVREESWSLTWWICNGYQHKRTNINSRTARKIKSLSKAAVIFWIVSLYHYIFWKQIHIRAYMHASTIWPSREVTPPLQTFVTYRYSSCCQ